MRRKNPPICPECFLKNERAYQAQQRRLQPLKYTAYARLGCAIERGDIPKATAHLCVDCGKPAKQYDHRDYTKPLDVVPVCRRCNKLRGPAYPYLTVAA